MYYRCLTISGRQLSLVTSPKPAAPPDTGRMPSTRGGAQSNPLSSPGGAGAQDAPTNTLPSPKLREKMIKVYRTHCDVRGFDYQVIRDSVESV